jgi:hypothetical protein
MSCYSLQKNGPGAPGGQSWTVEWLRFDNSYFKVCALLCMAKPMLGAIGPRLPRWGPRPNS